MASSAHGAATPTPLCPSAPSPSPEARASWVSRALSYSWLNPLLRKGMAQPLEESDLYAVPDQLDVRKLGQQLDAAWQEELKRRPPMTKPHGATSADHVVEIAPTDDKPTPTDTNSRIPSTGPSLAAVLFCLHKRAIIGAGICKGIADALSLLQPILLQWLLDFLVEWNFNPDQGLAQPPYWRGFVLAASLGVCPFVGGMLQQCHDRYMGLAAFQVRSSIVQVLYRKALVLSPRSRSQHSTGRLVTMMSSDSYNLETFMQWLHAVWSAFAQIVVCIALLIRAIGWPAIVGLASLLLVAVPTAAIIFRFMQLAGLHAPIKDARVKRMSEILQNIRLVKLYGWEDAMRLWLNSVRARELEVVQSQQNMNVGLSTLMTAAPVVVSTMAFVALGLSRDTFPTAEVFSALALFQILRMPLIMGPMAVATGSAAAVSLSRIQEFLLAEELDWQPKLAAPGQLHDGKGMQIAIRMADASFQWHVPVADADGQDAEQKPPGAGDEVVVEPLKRVEAGFKLASLNVSIPRGALVAVVGGIGSGKSSLLASLLGEMQCVSGEVELCGSVAYCAQNAWIQNASIRDNILFGLPFLPLRFQDAVRFAALTQDLQLLPAGDMTEVGESGITLSGGQKQRVALARALYANSDILLLDDPLSAVDAHVGHFLFHDTLRQHLAGRTRVLVTHQLHFVVDADWVLLMEGGAVAEAGSFAELNSRPGGKFRTLMQAHGGRKEEEPKLPNPQQKQLQHARSASGAAAAAAAGGPDKPSLLAEVAKLMETEERIKGGVQADTYLYYARAGGGWLPVVNIVVWLLISAGLGAYQQLFLASWTDDDWHLSGGTYVGIYSAICSATILFTAFLQQGFASMSVRASRELHERSFARILRAPINTFFDVTPLGRILARFSKDQDSIDTQTMRAIENVLSNGATFIGVIVVIAIVIPWIVIPFVFVLMVYMYVERAYRNTTRELKRIENITRSPVFAGFSEALTGLSTIRGYGVQSLFLDAHIRRVNTANAPTLLHVMVQRWLGVRVETISAGIAFLTALLVVIQRDTLSAGQAGVALVYACSLPMMLNFIVQCTADAESAMNSVERAKFYSEIPQEAPAVVEADKQHMRLVSPVAAVSNSPGQSQMLAAPLKEWQGEGAVRFDNVRLQYRAGLPEVLRGVSFSIRPRERVGIVGRTGSGKSSLLVALYRLVELDAEHGGRILIDGVDTHQLGLATLRQHCLAIMSQEAQLFEGTIRSNLDPFGSCVDEQLWHVLERAHLAATIRAKPDQLSASVVEGGTGLSAGERSQLCLARAMLRKGARIFAIDEGTASIDLATDALIQQTLRQDFAHCTLLTVAHRLVTIMDYDRVLVMADGAVAEFDTPAALLRKPDSHFARMVADTGPAQAKLLADIAFQAERGSAQREAERGGVPAGAAFASLSRVVVDSILLDQPLAAAAASGSDDSEHSVVAVRWHHEHEHDDL